MPFPVPSRERERLEALRDLDILDTSRERAFEDVAELAAAICAAPIAIVNFIDADRQWGKAVVGLSSSELPREHSFCAHAIVATDGLLVVPDAHADPAWADNPSVVGATGIRFYAGAAIVDAQGHALGTVCVADTRPRRPTARALAGLCALARQTAALLELRRSTSWLVAANAELHRHSVEDPLTGLASRVAFTDRLAQALRTRLRTGRDVGLAVCAIEGFAVVNARFGHQGGDELVRVVAGRIAGQARGSDVVARLAGGEFAVLCAGLVTPNDVRAVVPRLRAAVEQPLTLHGEPLVPRLGVAAVLAEPGEDADGYLARALGALQAA